MAGAVLAAVAEPHGHATTTTTGHDHQEHGFFRSLFSRHRHDSAASIDSALESSEKGIRALWISLVVLGATALLQLVVALLSGSVALLNDTFHNFADAFTALPLWLAFSLGRRRPSDRYPFGYGRAEDLAGGAVVAMIALSAVVAAWEAIDRLLHPTGVRYLGAVFVASLVGFAGNELVAQHRIRVGREIGSAALVADGLHARTDGLSSLGVLAGALGVAAGFDRADAIAGLVIAALILSVLRQAAGDVVARLMDAVDPALAERARGGADRRRRRRGRGRTPDPVDRPPPPRRGGDHRRRRPSRSPPPTASPRTPATASSTTSPG